MQLPTMSARPAAAAGSARSVDIEKQPLASSAASVAAAIESPLRSPRNGEKSDAPHDDSLKALSNRIEVASYGDEDADHPGNVDKPIVLPNNSFGRALGYLADKNLKLEAKLGIEARGIQRVRPDERTDTRLWGNMMVWLAANCCVPSFSIGVLGPFTFGLHLGDSLLTIAFFVLFAGCFPALCATFGPQLGLRQMTASRYAWGYWGAKGVALLNCMACVGWSISNTISGAQVLDGVDNFHLGGAAGVVIIGLITLCVGLFGYRVVHYYEMIAWFPTFVSFVVACGVAGKHFVSLPLNTGSAEAASVLSFGGTVWGFVIGWVSLASDYNVYMPQNAPRKRIFLYTYVGITAPCILLMFLGAAMASGATSVTDARGDIIPGANPVLVHWYQGYQDHELGGLLRNVLVPPMGGGGKFFMVILVLSVVSNNVVNVYSMGLSVSVISHYLAALPRLIWPIVVTAIYIPVGIVGFNSFATSLQDFMGILGYWLAIFVTVLLLEHFVFRKNDFANYHVAQTWNNRHKLPVSWAALGAFCFGVLGVCLGMDQTWWVAPVAKTFGGDIGFELASGFAGLAFLVLRPLEIKYLGL